MTTTRLTGGSALPAIGLCLLAAMLEGFDIASMGVAAPKMIPALGLSKPEAGWAFSASLLGLMIGAAVAGPLADQVFEPLLREGG
ncbi:MAG TPA: hypothetical protein PLO65_06085, partial [Caulobacter sp.]|nr:hypothetical protein [Caulobacter sp.]